MARTKIDRYLAPWVFVLTGILFNILSAVITHYFIGQNGDRINAIDRKINSSQVLIDSQWQSKTEVERKKEFFILLLSANPVNPDPGKNYLQAYVADLVDANGLSGFESRMDDSIDLNLLVDISDAAQKAIIATINNTYFETLELQEAKLPLERANSRLFSIAIFLQVTGLILVLARDLRRT